MMYCYWIQLVGYRLLLYYSIVSVREGRVLGKVIEGEDYSVSEFGNVIYFQQDFEFFVFF